MEYFSIAVLSTGCSKTDLKTNNQVEEFNMRFIFSDFITQRQQISEMLREDLYSRNLKQLIPLVNLNGTFRNHRLRGASIASILLSRANKMIIDIRYQPVND